MDTICYKKDKVGLTNLEKNFLAAIQDEPTIVELLLLAMYNMAFSHPYMRYVRGPGVEHVNLLDLGPLHRNITDHYHKIIADPDLVIGANASGATGTFDGHTWHNKTVAKAVQEWIPKILYFRDAFVVFMEGCLETWTRFTSEFEAGGLIDGLTAEEREAAWMPATNDINEGALGTLRITMRRKPCLTLHQFNARFMYNQNKTQEWMDKTLTDDDLIYLRQQAQKLDESKPELKRKAEQVEADEAAAKAKRAKITEQIKKKDEALEKLRNVVLVLEEQKIRQLGVKAVKEQLNVYCISDSEVPIKAWLNKAGPEGQREHIEALLAAIARMRARGLSDPRSDTSDEVLQASEGSSRMVRGDYIYISEDEEDGET